LDKFLNFSSSKQYFTDRFFDSGFDSHSFLLNTSDILFMFFVTTMTLLIYLAFFKIFCKSESGQKRLAAKMRSYKYGAYIELLEASYLILFHTCFLNCLIINSDNFVELVQSVLSLVIGILLALFPLIYLIFMLQNYEKIKRNDPEFSNKYGSFWADLNKENKTSFVFKSYHYLLRVLYSLLIFGFADAPLV